MDIRLHKDICSAYNLLNKLDNINFISSNFIENNRPCEVGVIAQELGNQLPNIIKNKNGFIPNINMNNVYHELISNNNVYIQINHKVTLHNGDIILMSINGNKIISNVLNVTDVSFEVEKWINYDKNDILYIYGTNTQDYYMIDKLQFISFIGGSTKELYQIVKQQASTISTLQNQLNQVITWATAQGFTLTQ